MAHGARKTPFYKAFRIRPLSGVIVFCVMPVSVSFWPGVWCFGVWVHAEAQAHRCCSVGFVCKSTGYLLRRFALFVVVWIFVY